MSGRLAQLRAAGQLLCVPRPWSGPYAGATRTRSTACGPPGVPGRGQPRRADPSGSWGLGGGGSGAERSAGVRTWAPLAMAAKVDLSTSTDWKEAKCKCKQEGGARGRGRPHVGLARLDSTATSTAFHPRGALGWTPPVAATPPVYPAPQTTSLRPRGPRAGPLRGSVGRTTLPRPHGSQGTPRGHPGSATLLPCTGGKLS